MVFEFTDDTPSMTEIHRFLADYINGEISTRDLAQWYYTVGHNIYKTAPAIVQQAMYAIGGRFAELAGPGEECEYKLDEREFKLAIVELLAELRYGRPGC